MPIIPVRELAAKGILRDPSPYQLDMPAWSAGAGVRFHANTVDAAPIWRLVEDSLSVTPVFCVGYEPSTGYDLVTVASSNGQLWQYGSGAVTNVTQNRLGVRPAAAIAVEALFALVLVFVRGIHGVAL